MYSNYDLIFTHHLIGLGLSSALFNNNFTFLTSFSLTNDASLEVEMPSVTGLKFNLLKIWFDLTHLLNRLDLNFFKNSLI